MNVTDLNNITEHPFCLLEDKITEICSPLFNNFPINYFAYGRIYRENRVAMLVSDKNWTCDFLQSNHQFLVNGQKIHPWSSTMSLKAQEEAAEFNHYNGILLEKEYPEYIEELEFASPNQNASPLEFCCNRDLLNQFLIYFRDKADSLIKIVEREPICLPKNRFQKQEGRQSYSICYAEFYKLTNTKKARFKFKSKEIFFTRREFEALSLMAKGKSMVEAAEILKISRRTVEKHLYNAKNKTDIFTISQLLDNFTENLF